MYTLFAKAFFVSYLCTVKRDEALLIRVRRVSYLIYYIGVLIPPKKTSLLANWSTFVNLKKTTNHKKRFTTMILFKATVRKNFKTGEKLFYPMLVEPSVVSFEELLNSVQEICSLTLADVTAIVKSFQEVVLEMLSEGYSVHVDNLGSFRPTLKATSVENKDDVSADLIKQVHCVFTPSVRLKEAIKMNNLEFKKLR